MNPRIAFFSFVIFLWIGFIDGQSTCPIKFTKVGCYKDKHKSPRPLPNLIMTDRDKKVKVYSRKEINWKDWSNYVPDFACRCAKATKAKGWKDFGLQYYGECWSSATSNYKIDGVAPKGNCVGLDLKQKECPQSSPFCVGKQYTNYVYRIVQTINPVNPTKPTGPTVECEKFVVDIKMPGIKVTENMNVPVSADFLNIKAEVEKIILQAYGDYESYLSFTLLKVTEDNKTVIAHVYLVFTKKGKHALPLLEKVGKDRLIKTECFKPQPSCQGSCPYSCTPICSSECCYPSYTYPMYYR